jgi:S1-C subfamily serine protease
MPETGASPVRGVKLSPRYLAVLVAAALAILVVGSALRPHKPASEAAPPPSQTEILRLQRLAERQSLETMTGHFAAVAGDALSHLVSVGRSSASGVVWSPDLVVAAEAEQPSSDPVTLVTPAGDEMAAARVVGGPGLPLAAFQPAARLDPAPRRKDGTEGLAPGAWLVAVWREAGGHAFAPGHFVESFPVHCDGLEAREVASSLPLRPWMAGAGLFDLDGALVGVVLPCGSRYAVLGLESVALGLVRGRSLEGRLRTLYGLRTAPLDDAARAHLGVASGAFVVEVWTGYPADRAGLRPGDVITSLEAGPVTSPDDLQPLLASTQREGAVLGVRRARQRREIRLAAGGRDHAATPDEPGPGLRLAPPAEGLPIASIVPGSAAAEAGIREGDRLLRVDFVAPRTAAEARRALSGRGGPVLVEVQSGARRIGALLLPR